MAVLTDAQLTVLGNDLITAFQAQQTAAANLAAARKALAQGLGPGGSCVIKGRLVTANADGTDILASTPTRVVT